MSALIDEMLADHRILTNEEALKVTEALQILGRHAKGIRGHTSHPQAGQAADIVERIAYPVAQLLESMLDNGMIAPAGYVPGTE